MILAYLKALGKHLWTLLSCAVFTIIALVAAGTNRSNTWQVWVSVGAAAILLHVASFLVWQDECKKASEAISALDSERSRVEQPDIALVWDWLAFEKKVHDTYGSTEKHILIHNRSREYVYNVQISPILLGKSLTFDRVPEIPPNEQHLSEGRWEGRSSRTTNYVYFFSPAEAEAREKNLFITKPHDRGLSSEVFKIPMTVTYEARGLRWESSFQFTYDPGEESYFEKLSGRRLP